MDKITAKIFNNKLKKLDSETYDEYFGRLAKMERDAKESGDLALITEINNIVYSYKPLQGFIIMYCKTSCPSYFETHKADLIQAAYEEFFNNFFRFDASKATLITFSKIHALHGLQGQIAFILNKRTVFEKEIAINVGKIKRQLLEAGYEEEMITASLVHGYLPKYAYSQIEACLKFSDPPTQSVPSDEFLANISETKGSQSEDSPARNDAFNTIRSAETQFFDKNMNDEIDKLLAFLSPYERRIISLIDVDNTTRIRFKGIDTDRELIRDIKAAGLTKIVSTNEDGEEYVPTAELKKIHSAAKAHLFHIALTKTDNYKRVKSAGRQKITDHIDFNLLAITIQNEDFMYKCFCAN